MVNLNSSHQAQFLNPHLHSPAGDQTSICGNACGKLTVVSNRFRTTHKDEEIKTMNDNMAWDIPPWIQLRVEAVKMFAYIYSEQCLHIAMFAYIYRVGKIKINIRISLKRASWQWATFSSDLTSPPRERQLFLNWVLIEVANMNPSQLAFMQTGICCINKQCMSCSSLNDKD